jgi:hypothetical protein
LLGASHAGIEQHAISTADVPILMCRSGTIHVYRSVKPIVTYVKNKTMLISTIVLTIFMMFLFVVGMNKQLNPESIEAVKKAMSQVESRE